MPQCTLDNSSVQGCQRYPAVSDVYGCRGYFTVLWIETSFIRNTQYSKCDPSVSTWLREGIAIPLNTAKFYKQIKCDTTIVRSLYPYEQ